jgi:hypothetical protein
MGIACPQGAHYLPLPGDDAPAVQDLLEELGLRQRVAGRWQYDEQALCHSPQERLFFGGQWQAGLLPVQGVGEARWRSTAALPGWCVPRSRPRTTPFQCKNRLSPASSLRKTLSHSKHG